MTTVRESVQLDAGGVRLERRAGRRHQVGDDVHRLAGRGAAHLALEQRLHLRRRAPVVVDAGVGRVARRDDRPLLGAGGVLVVAARVVETLAGGQQLAGGERLLGEPGVVGRADDLDPLGARQVGPVAHVLAHVGVRQSGLVQCCLNVCHRLHASRVWCAPSDHNTG